jgi:regulator of sigma E protease
MMSLIVAITGLGLLIVLHEAGHFIVARLCGMRVERFSIGFGPALLGFKRGGTTFQIAPIPLGGFVQITGLNPAEDFDRSDPCVYPNRPRWMRFLTMVGGPAANYFTAFVLLFMVLLIFGMPSKTLQIFEAIAGKPAAAAGLRAGDVVVEANGQPISADFPIGDVLRAGQGAPLSIRVLRNGQPLTFSLTPERQSSGAFLIGVNIGRIVKRNSVRPGTALKEAITYPYVASLDILGGFYDLVRGRVPLGELSGPIGITREIKQAADQGVVEYLSMLIMLSIYLGLFNLLPLPALDGGRALVLAIESLTSRRLNPRIEAAVHATGLIVFLIALIAISVKDLFGRG